MTDAAVNFLGGPPAAPPLVLVGSLGTTGAVWADQVNALRPWFRLLAVEHPGHGAADVPEGEGSLDALGNRLVQLLDQLGTERCHFAGLSLGGLVGMWLAAHHPERVERLAVICSAARFDSATFRERASLVRDRGLGAVAPAVLSRWFTEPFARERPEVAAKYTAIFSSVDPAGYAYCCEAIAGADLRADLARIQAPTLVVGGALDPVVSPSTATSVAAAIRDATLCVLPNAAHLANVEKPTETNEILLNHFLGTTLERGLEVRKSTLGQHHVEQALASSSELTADFQDLLSRWPWGAIWARPGLDRHTRRLLTIALLVALNRPEELRMHVRQALSDNVSVGELKEVLLHTAIYAGVPAANSAFAISDHVLRGDAG
jgi:3-oxoadipate enol-lactonase/4-carboxymuconolactone decarboxylase